MTPEARRTLATIRQCLADDHFYVTVHFRDRLEERFLFWPDVEAVVDDPADVESKGLDDFGRPNWAVSGEAADGGDIEIICAVETDGDRGTTFVTLYWED